MTEATRFPYQPADLAGWVNAHDEFHRVGYHGPNKVGSLRSDLEQYYFVTIRNGDKVYMAAFSEGLPDWVDDYKDGVYQPMVTGLEAPEKESGQPSLTPSGTPIELDEKDLEA